MLVGLLTGHALIPVGLAAGLGCPPFIDSNGDGMLASAQRFLDAGIVFDHMHAERVEGANRVEFVNQRVHDDQILIPVLRGVP